MNRWRAERGSSGSRSLSDHLVDIVSEGIYVVDRNRRILSWNAAAERITGYEAREVIGRRCADRILNHCNARGEILCGTDCPLTATMLDGEPRELEAFLLHHDGRRVPVNIRSSAVRDGRGAIVGCAELFVDTSPINAMLDELRCVRENASIDSLTGVGNRRFIQERLAAFGRRRRTTRKTGVVFFDIDGFKNINDAHGHDIGDIALQQVAATATGILRSFDTVGRWGGDEFVVIVPGADRVGARAIAERLRAMVAAVRIAARGTDVNFTISAGVTTIRPGESGEEALTRADRLMYESKALGRDRVTAG